MGLENRRRLSRWRVEEEEFSLDPCSLYLSRLVRTYTFVPPSCSLRFLISLFCTQIAKPSSFWNHFESSFVSVYAREFVDLCCYGGASDSRFVDSASRIRENTTFLTKTDSII